MTGVQTCALPIFVNTVFLTDGEGALLNRHYENGFQQSANFTHMVIRDPKTCEETVYDNSNAWRSGMLQTDCLLKLLKIRTNSHVIGFFVGSINDVLSRENYFWPDRCNDVNDKYKNREEIKEKFRKENSLVINSTAFDDYYILRSSGLDTDDEELTFSAKATTRGMASAFSKYAGNKISSRVILNRFIGLIT